MSYLDKAKRFVRKGIEKLTDEDKLVIGHALLEGRAAHPSDKEFGQWREANGFGDLTWHEVREWQWLAENAHWLFYQEHGKSNIRAAMVEWFHQHPEVSPTGRVRKVFEAEPERTFKAEDIETEASLPRVEAQKILVALKRRGDVVRPKRGEYRLATETEKAQVVESRETPPATTDQPENVFNLTHGLQTIFNRLTKRIKKVGTSKGWPTTEDPPRSGLASEELLLVGHETWKDAVEVPPAADEAQMKGYKIAGWAKGYRARLVIDPVWVPVNVHGESLCELQKPRQETDETN